jgi:TrmH family RNA methyltransferase
MFVFVSKKHSDLRMLTKNEIKYIRLLQDKKHRDAEQKFVAEGTKWIEELLKWQPLWLEKLYTTQGWLSDNGMHIAPKHVQLVESFELEKISGLMHPSPAIAVAYKPKNEPVPFSPDQWNIVLDGIQDPGNLGSIIRIADWFGLKAIWCSHDCADAFNPKVVQSTMGSLCRVKVVYDDVAKTLDQTSIPIYLSGMEGKSLFDIHEKTGILVVGSEGKGVRKEIASKVRHHITIPRIGHAESLNAAVATGIMVAKLTAEPEKSKGH